MEESFRSRWLLCAPKSVKGHFHYSSRRRREVPSETASLEINTRRISVRICRTQFSRSSVEHARTLLLMKNQCQFVRSLSLRIHRDETIRTVAYAGDRRCSTANNRAPGSVGSSKSAEILSKRCGSLNAVILIGRHASVYVVIYFPVRESAQGIHSAGVLHFRGMD